MSEFTILSVGKLKTKKVSINHLYLDPNNPRFMGVESTNVTPKDKYTLAKVQARALENMKKYGIKELRENIEEVGFLPIDKMVFAEIEGKPNEYFAIEGNRRLAAIKWLLNEYEAGEVTVKPEILATVEEIEVYILEQVSDLRRTQNLLQGIRHMSGIRDWRPYQKAKLVDQLMSEGKTPSEIARMFGTSTQTVMRLYRTFLVFEEFRNDETYGEHWNAELFRMFDDVMRRPRLRNDWLGWDEEQRKFKNVTELEYFYKWIICDPETNERKIPGANYMKDLDEVVTHAKALDYLKQEGTSLASALAMTRKTPEVSWITEVEEATIALREIEAFELEHLSTENEEKLHNLRLEIANALERAKKLRK
jgi:hypothetical protein